MTEQELLAQPGEVYMSEAQQGYFRELLLLRLHVREARALEPRL